eukprot:CAMPEP_0184502070 /NCGR_PEP_ID=MMETSP0113_2-20130426/49286_1 /TAXON_ID=91329 /ORGANISM="Norrisiella sphaerica, Strain BC52" /LENGTH=444 /DNA_ID=CAMNT_0026891061 /DNA_START=189 /DNA_END=1520 /DNA_ORIENTATION=+
MASKGDDGRDVVLKRAEAKSSSSSEDLEEYELEDGRHFRNPFLDSEPPTQGWREELLKAISWALKVADKPTLHTSGSIYSGQAGFALALYYLEELGLWKKTDQKTDGGEGISGAKSEADRRTQLFQKAIEHCNQSLLKIHPRRLTFLEGQVGPIALLAALYHKLGNTKERDAHVSRCLKLAQKVSNLKKEECEVLYGRAGYLSSILFMRRQINDNKIGSKEAEKLIEDIITEGEEGARKCPEAKLRLLYTWHGKCYLGAAHGLCGIFMILLQFSAEVRALKLLEIVKKGLDDLLELRYQDSQNMPSSFGNRSDRLVHWCHGAVGYVSLCVLASRVFEDENYLKLAKSFGHVVWKRGLLSTKGPGLCHGIPGNGMVFLTLYRATKDKLWLRRARHFSAFAATRLQDLAHLSSDPASLFTGVLGASVFFASTLHPDQSHRFIGYEF